LQFKFEPFYPFTIYHSASKLNRRYTLYAASERERSKWEAALVDALGVRAAQGEANQVRIER
jgi:RHO1 GDP-GTP exchange protein 1/2